MNEVVTPNFTWKCEWKNDKLQIISCNNWFKFEVEGEFNNLYDKVNGGNEEMEYIKIKLMLFNVNAPLKDSNTETIHVYNCKKDTIRLYLLKNNCSFISKENIFNNYCFMKIWIKGAECKDAEHDYEISRQVSDYCICLNNGIIYRKHFFRKNNEWKQCLIGVSISLNPNGKGVEIKHVYGLGYINGRFGRFTHYELKEHYDDKDYKDNAKKFEAANIANEECLKNIEISLPR